MSLRSKFNKLTKRCHKFEHYFPLYEKHFQKYVGKSPKILEIGVFGGGSLELWKEYFGPGTKVVGVDINPHCKQYEDKDIEIIIGDQSDPTLWKHLSKNEFDIVIDDGSHVCSHQISTLQMAYKCIKQEGTYWCEDVHTSYWEKFEGGLGRTTSFIEYTKLIIDVVNEHHSRLIRRPGKKYIDNPGPKIDKNFVDTFNDVQGIHFYDSVVVIDKGKRDFIRDILVNK